MMANIHKQNTQSIKTSLKKLHMLEAIPPKSDVYKLSLLTY